MPSTPVALGRGLCGLDAQVECISDLSHLHCLADIDGAFKITGGVGQMHRDTVLIARGIQIGRPSAFPNSMAVSSAGPSWLRAAVHPVQHKLPFEVRDLKRALTAQQDG